MQTNLVLQFHIIDNVNEHWNQNVKNHENTLIDLVIRSSIPSTLSIHSIGIPSIPNLAPKQAPITVALEQESPKNVNNICKQTTNTYNWNKADKNYLHIEYFV